MLSLVDYEGSDSDASEQGDQNEENVAAEVFPNPKKSVNIIAQESIGDLDSRNDSVPTDNEGGEEDLTVSGSSLLASLPSASHEDVGPKTAFTEEALEDIVQKKDWELKEMKKVEKKKRKLEKRRRKELRRARKRSVRKSESDHSSKEKKEKKKKKVRIEAFGGLPGLEKDSDEYSTDNETGNSVNSTGKKSKGLLSLLPHPRNEQAIGKSKITTVLLPSSLKQPKRPSVVDEVENVRLVETSKPSVSAEHVGSNSDDGDDDGSIDFFGLNSVEPPGEADFAPETRISSVPYGPARPKDQTQFSSYETTLPEYGEAVGDAGPSSSGMIDDSEAARLIYSNNVAPYGGSERDLNDSLKNIIDVNVDQALGPNIRANLLKNLHNKSLAEAAISHLSRIPKARDAKDVVARRKHQITYLATVAVAREEQLAEQWSQNRHAKRMSAQKYGF